MGEFLGPQNDFAKEINFIDTSTITNGNKQIVPLSSGLGFNVPTSGIFALSINGSNIIQFSSATGGTKHFLRQITAGGVVTSSNITPSDLTISGTADSTTFLRGDGVYSNVLTGALSLATALNFTSNTGSITAGTRQVVATTNGLELNTPTGTALVWNINNSLVGYLSASSWCYGIQTNSNSYIYGDGSSYLLNTPTGSSFNFGVNGTTIGNLSSTLFSLTTTNGLAFSGTGSTTAANRQIVGTSSGLAFNTPTSTSLLGYVNGTQVFEASSGNIWNLGNFLASTQNYIAADASGVVLNISTGNTFNVGLNGTTLQVTSTGVLSYGSAGFVLANTSGSLTTALRQIAGTSDGVSIGVPSGKAIVGSINGTQCFRADNASGSGYIQLGTLSGSASFLYGDDNGPKLNGPTGSTITMGFNAGLTLALTSTFLALYSTNGITLVGSTGTVTAGSKQIVQTANGVEFNTPSASNHRFSINNGNVASLGVSDWNIGTNTGSNCVIAGNSTFKAISINVPSTGFLGFYINNTLYESMDAQGLTLYAGGALQWSSPSGTVAAATIQVIGTSYGLAYNVATSKKHSFRVNDVEIAAIDAGGLTVANAPQDYFMFASRKYR